MTALYVLCGQCGKPLPFLRGHEAPETCWYCGGKAMTDDHGERLVRIETKLDTVLKHQELQNGRLNQHSQRMGSLERWRAYITGALAILSLLFGGSLAAWLRG